MFLQISLDIELATVSPIIINGLPRRAGDLHPGNAVDPTSLQLDTMFSTTAQKIVSAYNSAAIKQGRCEVKQGDVSALTLPEGKYDLATAFETIYFWPGLKECFAQVAKVLKPGGTFMIVNESDGMDETSLKYEKIIGGMKCHTVEEIEGALKEAGFNKVKSDHHKGKPWITVIARK